MGQVILHLQSVEILQPSSQGLKAAYSLQSCRVLLHEAEKLSFLASQNKCISHMGGEVLLMLYSVSSSPWAHLWNAPIAAPEISKQSNRDIKLKSTDLTCHLCRAGRTGKQDSPL